MCQSTIFGDADDSPCICKQAVKRAYATLIKAGEPETIAMMAAKRVYKHHHPEDSIQERNLTVERWVAGALH